MEWRGGVRCAGLGGAILHHPSSTNLRLAQYLGSQREPAEAAHVPQSTIARIESGAREPSLPSLIRTVAAVDLEAP
jgi:predicted transcriptional regulator